MLVLSGCLDADFRLEQSIKEAVAQAQEGNTAAAINKLESLQDKHPNNADIAEALAIAYTEHGNYLLASNYYQKSARLSADKRHLLKLSAEGQIRAGRKEDAASRLQTYLQTFPEDGETWLELGRIQYDLQHQEEAIDAMTRGLLLTGRDEQKATDHQKLGSLYLNLKDYAQADYYLNSALTLAKDKTVEGQVLAGLVESSVEQEDWDVADIFLKRIASTQPELLNTSEVKQLKNTVDQIFSLRDGTTSEVVKVKVQQKDRENPEAESAELKTETETVLDNNDLPQIEQTESIEESEVSDETSDSSDSETVVSSEIGDESQSMHAELDDSTAPEAEIESTPEETSEVEVASLSGGLLSEVNPTDSNQTQVEEAETLTDQTAEEASMSLPEASEDAEANTETLVDQSMQTEPLSDNETNTDLADDQLEEPAQEPLDPYVAPENEAELLLIQAQQAIADGDVPAAIRMSWDSINKRPENPAGWFILSRAYSKFGQDLNAESAALEAMRLNPKNKKIVFNYLGILQRSRGANRFHEELLKAYRNFSSDPDFVLALARSYARIKNDPQNSAALYRRFFDLAPDHENAAEIRQEASYVE